MSEGARVASRNWTREEMRSPLEPPGGAQSCPHLDWEASDQQN